MKIIETYLKYSGRIMGIEASKIDFSKGKIVEFERSISTQGIDKGVMVIPWDVEKESIFMVSQFQYGQELELLTLPRGGLANPQENPEYRAQLELREEIGKGAEHLEFLTELLINPGYARGSTYVYLATGLKDAPLEGDEEEDVKVLCFEFKKVLEMIKSGEIRDSRTVAALLFFDKFER